MKIGRVFGLKHLKWSFSFCLKPNFISFTGCITFNYCFTVTIKWEVDTVCNRWTRKHSSGYSGTGVIFIEIIITSTNRLLQLDSSAYSVLWVWTFVWVVKARSIVQMLIVDSNLMRLFAAQALTYHCWSDLPKRWNDIEISNKVKQKSIKALFSSDPSLSCLTLSVSQSPSLSSCWD